MVEGDNAASGVENDDQGAAHVQEAGRQVLREHLGKAGHVVNVFLGIERGELPAEDFERAADLVELAIRALRPTRQEAMVRRWLEELPDDVVRVRPVLSVTFAGALLMTDEIEGLWA